MTTLGEIVSELALEAAGVRPASIDGHVAARLLANESSRNAVQFVAARLNHHPLNAALGDVDSLKGLPTSAVETFKALPTTWKSAATDAGILARREARRLEIAGLEKLARPSKTLPLNDTQRAALAQQENTGGTLPPDVARELQTLFGQRANDIQAAVFEWRDQQRRLGQLRGAQAEELTAAERRSKQAGDFMSSLDGAWKAHNDAKARNAEAERLEKQAQELRGVVLS